jgi:hypothetical protein
MADFSYQLASNGFASISILILVLSSHLCLSIESIVFPIDVPLYAFSHPSHPPRFDQYYLAKGTNYRVIF